MKNKLLFLGALAALIAGCEKINEDPVFDTKPLIDLVAISADTLVEFQENLVLTISYQDGDGDGYPADPGGGVSLDPSFIDPDDTDPAIVP